MYKYELLQGSAKLTCPACGKKTFVPYVYTDTKGVVDSRFGRCDRESKCAYHSHPNDDQQFTPSHTPKPQPRLEIRQIFPNQQTLDLIIKRTRTATSPFHQFCKTLNIPADHLINRGVYTDGSEEDKTAFLFISREQKVCNIKWFKFQANGHRDKSFQAYSLPQPKPDKKKFSTPSHTPLKENFGEQVIVEEKYLLCLQGEHLLDPSKEKVVVLVESEKTASIASWYYKHFDWVSCGSANGLGVPDGVPGDFKLRALYGRKVIWLADADKAGRKNKSIELLEKYQIEHCVLDLYPDRDDGYDIADDIAVGVLPDVIFTPKMQPDDDARNYESEYDLPKGCKWEDIRESVIKYRSFNFRNKTYIVKHNAKGKHHCTPITNFVVESLGHIESLDNPRRLIRIKNVHNISKELEVPTKAFASNTEFTIFIESEGNFQYDGSSSDLKCIRSRLYDTMKTYKEIDTLGWNEGYFFFANGLYNGVFKKADKYGFVSADEKTSYFIPALSSINKHAEEDWEDERKFVYVNSKVKLKDWAKMFCDVHKDNGKVAFAWFLASLFRDIIYRVFKFFPHLFLFGPPGTGKSQVGWSVRALGFASIKKPFNLSGGTKVAFHREFSHFVNFPCWFDEYDNNIDYDRVQSLKAAYDGAGHKKSVKDSDKRTKTVPVNSAAMISGQQLPIADIALFKRVILCQFHQTEFDDSEKKAFRDLQNLEEGGLSHITASLMKFRGMVEEKYIATFDEVLADYMQNYGYDVEDRIMRNMCVIATIIKLLEPEIGAHLPYTYAEFKKVGIRFVQDQMALINRSNETNQFWDMVQYLIEQKLIMEEKDYKFRAKSELKIMADRNTTAEMRLDNPNTTVLYLRVSKIIPMYRENFRKQNSTTVSPMDKNSLLHYLQHQKYYLGFIKNSKFETGEIEVVNGNSKSKTSNFSCYAFNYDIMEAMGVEMKRANSDDHINNDEPDF